MNDQNFEDEAKLITDQIAKILFKSTSEFIRFGQRIFLNKAEIGALVYTGVFEDKHNIELIFKNKEVKTLHLPVGDVENYL